ncbi:hypothetical protein MNBD_ALPHA08-763, partial [hydrothermal vent metagenome]
RREKSDARIEGAMMMSLAMVLFS